MFDVLICDAQISTEEIKKYHIYKITEKSYVGDTLSETSTLYYDKKGNIIKEISGGLIETKTNSYENDRLKKVTSFCFNGKEEETTEYFYNLDGSYMTISTFKNFGAKNYFWFKANGDVIKAFGGDTLFYNYNELGKLEEIKTDSNGQIKFYTKFIYNPKGQLMKVEMPKDEFNSMTENYEYDLNGKRIKATQRKILYGMTSTSVFTYEYNKKGLLVKEITINTNDGGKSTTTKNIYEYQFYKN